MKKKLALFTLFGFLAMASVSLFAQDDSIESTDSKAIQEVMEETVVEEAAPVVPKPDKQSEQTNYIQ